MTSLQQMCLNHQGPQKVRTVCGKIRPKYGLRPAKSYLETSWKYGKTQRWPTTSETVLRSLRR